MPKLLALFICLVFMDKLCAQAQEKNVRDAFIISRMVEKFHVEPRPLDKTMSSAIFLHILEELDDQRFFFTQDDIKKLSVFQFKLDDEIRNRQSSFLQLLTSIYRQRLQQVDTMIDNISVKPFNFSVPDKLTQAEDTIYPADLAAVHIKLYKLLKFTLLNTVADYVITSGRNPSKKMVDSLEAVLRKKAGISVKRSIKRILQSPLGVDNTIGIIYCQALASCYDPHTAYFPLEEKIAFESGLGNKPLSFGLSLNEDEDGNPKIGKLEPGGPAFQSGALHEGDKIIAVQWDDKEFIDVSNAATDEIENILAAEGGTRLTLRIKKTDGTAKEVVLRKERVGKGDEEEKVKGFILKGAQTVGYISLPAFYMDWESSKRINGCANDVAKEILKLKKENIGGLILDLRYNGGGSMEEAIELSGIFIDAGPVAQVKSKDAKAVTLKDVIRGTVYDGPLLILVNGSSASASEMVAGTLQDYNRALIVGSPTYGKATAQVVLPMDTTINLDTYDGRAEAASYIKLTTSKLYRINGTTAQVSGVKPDVLLPEPPGAMQDREADEHFALMPSVIDANKYYRPLPNLPISDEQAIAKRMMDSSSFFRQAQLHSAGPGKTLPNKEILLTLDDILQKKKKQMEETGGDPKNKKPLENTSFVVTNHAFEKARLQADHDLQEMNEERKKNVRDDPYIQIAFRLAAAMIK